MMPITNDNVDVSGPLRERRVWFEESVRSGVDPLQIARGNSSRIDTILLNLVQRSPAFQPNSEKIAILALGGYGRGEMCLGSDIDLLFLYDDDLSEDAVRDVISSILYPFWNEGVEIGGATRSIGVCKKVMAEDAKALTALIDARFIAGSKALFEKLLLLIREYFSSSERVMKFIEDKRRERKARLAHFGDTIFLLQPNIKESEGGLRDIDTLRWITMAASADPSAEEGEGDYLAKAIPSPAARKDVEDAVSFLWDIRNRLHLMDSGRKENLTEDVQEEVALQMGFVDKEDLSAAEGLMRKYYESASNIHIHSARSVLRIRRRLKKPNRLRNLFSRRRLGPGITRTAYGTIMIGPDHHAEERNSYLKLFRMSQMLGTPLDAATLDSIAHSGNGHDIYEVDDEASKLWLNILSELGQVGKTLTQMHECGYLANWFPEMRPMLHLVQHDGYHMYTAGKHSIMAIDAISNLKAKGARKKFPVLCRALRMIKRPHVLTLAILFHDLGKGRGGDHAKKGASLAGDICTRLMLSERDMNDVSFLIKSHLLMSKVAFMRDISDESFVQRFSNTFRTPEVLAMLYLLTYADIRAIGPGVWNDWKASLLSILFTKTLNIMITGGRSEEQRQKDEGRIKKKILSKLDKSYSSQNIDLYLKSLPERYLYSVSPETIAAHIIMHEDCDSDNVTLMSRNLEERGCTELSIITKDRPGLFAKIAGILSAGGGNIVDAQLYTTFDGNAIDVIWLTGSDHKPYADEVRWKKMMGELTAMLPQETCPGDLSDRFKSRILDVRKRPRESKIMVDNDVTPSETVVEIQTDDRMGLLYTVAFEFYKLGLTIDRALISTHVDRVIDVFYIRDEDGGKIPSKEGLKEIETALRNALGS